MTHSKKTDQEKPKSAIFVLFGPDMSGKRDSHGAHYITYKQYTYFLISSYESFFSAWLRVLVRGNTWVGWEKVLVPMFRGKMTFSTREISCFGLRINERRGAVLLYFPKRSLALMLWFPKLNLSYRM